MKHLVSGDESNSASTQPEPLTTLGETKLDTRKLVNVIIAKNFHLAPEGIQVQGLEVRIALDYSILL